MRYRDACIVLLAWLGCGPVVLAGGPDEASARDQFAAGTQHFQAQDYDAALAAFRAAVASGLSGPAVHYNIGVSAWQLGRLDEAEAAFRIVAAYPAMATVARYNLGLVALRRGHDDAARDWFEAAHAGDDDAIRRLAAAQLEALEPAPPSVEAAPRPVVFLSTRAGYDDNVVLAADGEILGVSDTGSSVVEAQLAGLVPLAAGIRLAGSAFMLRYPQLGEFDQAGGRVGLLARRGLGEWQGEIGVEYEFNRLDGRHFEDRIGLSATAYRSLPSDWDLRLRVRHEDIDGRPPYASLSGDRQELAVRLRRQTAGQELRVGYRYEHNDRAGAELSPDRHTLEAEWELDLRDGIRAVLGTAWRHSRYAPATGGWTERRSFVSAGVRGTLAGAWTWTAGYEWTDNDSADAWFDYRRQRLMVGVEALF